MPKLSNPRKYIECKHSHTCISGNLITEQGTKTSLKPSEQSSHSEIKGTKMANFSTGLLGITGQYNETFSC